MPNENAHAGKITAWHIAIITPVILALGFALGYITSGFHAYVNSLAPEYNTADTIREVTAFVETNEAWPRSWKELGEMQFEDVVVNWNLDISTCDRHDVMTALSPSTGRYRTYPHSGQDLDHLWEVVKSLQNSID